MRFLVDENVRREVRDFLASIGSAKYVPHGSSDVVVAHIAQAEHRILVTHDKDFGNALAYPPKRYAGIVIIRIHPPIVGIINGALSILFSRYDEKSLAGRIVILEASGFLINPPLENAE
ncbi:MAG: DUF5615 family PIN-like protein [Patescibacteria group bacterium]